MKAALVEASREGGQKMNSKAAGVFAYLLSCLTTTDEERCEMKGERRDGEWENRRRHDGVIVRQRVGGGGGGVRTEGSFAASVCQS